MCVFVSFRACIVHLCDLWVLAVVFLCFTSAKNVLICLQAVCALHMCLCMNLMSIIHAIIYMSSEKFKLISLNVRGISNFMKRRTIFTWCRKKKGDIIFLQETHSTKEIETQWKSEWGGKVFFAHGSHDSKGVAVLIKNGIDIHLAILDPQGRYIFLKIELLDKTNVGNIYVPNKDKISAQVY